MFCLNLVNQSQSPRYGPSSQQRREKPAAACEEQVAAEEPELTAVKAEKESKASKSAGNVGNKVVATNNKQTVEKTDEAKDVITEEQTVLVKKPMDEIYTVKLYTRHGNDKPNFKTTPSSVRELGGLDYYTLTYEDPSYSDDSE